MATFGSSWFVMVLIFFFHTKDLVMEEIGVQFIDCVVHGRDNNYTSLWGSCTYVERQFELEHSVELELTYFFTKLANVLRYMEQGGKK